VKKDTAGIDVTILDRKFRIPCSEQEKAGLLSAVEYLDAKMREIRDSGKANGTERVAVTAALNIAHELLTMRVGGAFDIGSYKRRMSLMAATIDEALSAQDKLF
jgi:cell division protein ZapA